MLDFWTLRMENTTVLVCKLQLVAAHSEQLFAKSDHWRPNSMQNIPHPL